MINCKFSGRLLTDRHGFAPTEAKEIRNGGNSCWNSQAKHPLPDYSVLGYNSRNRRLISLMA